MEFLNFLREELVIAWLVFLGLLITVVPVAAVLWRKMSGRNPVEAVKQPVQATKPFRGIQTELILVLAGILWLLAILVGWISNI